MNRKMLLTIFAASLLTTGICQNIQTTLTISNTKARITVRANGGTITGNASNFVFSVAIPVANSAASLTVTNLDASRLPTSLAAIGSYTDATYKYFNLTYTGTNATSSTWNSGTAYDLVELNFTGSTNGLVSLVSLPDGNPSAPALPSNWYNYVEISGSPYSDPTDMFYQSAFTGAPTQAVDYSTGTAIVTTNALVSLPASLTSFSALKSGAKNTLNWTVSSEINNKGFDLQRSTDGVNYSSIGFVNSTVGGNSSSEVHYSFADLNPPGKKQYYRLGQTDLDGRIRVSQVVTVSRESSGNWALTQIYPNPGRSQVQLSLESPQRGKVNILVVDISGRILSRTMAGVETGSNTLSMDISGLSSGRYLVKIIPENNSGSVISALFTRE